MSKSFGTWGSYAKEMSIFLASPHGLAGDMLNKQEIILLSVFNIKAGNNRP
jgi:hypothetical protein